MLVRQAEPSFDLHQAEPSFDLHQDVLDGATGFKVDITRVFDSNSGDELDVGIVSFRVGLKYSDPSAKPSFLAGTRCIELLDTPRAMDLPITNSAIDDAAGAATFQGYDFSGMSWPADLGHILTRLNGGANQSCRMDLELNSVAGTDGSVINVSPVLTQMVRRGDARADGVVNVADALFISQYLVGLRDACTSEVTTSCLHSVNAASVRQDGAFDKKTIADALSVAEYLVGLRGDFYTPVTPAELRCNYPSTGWSDDTPFFPGLPPTTVMAESILRQEVNLNGLAPAHQQLMKNYAQAQAHIFELLAALGELGELTCPGNTALLGGYPVRDWLEPWVINGLQGFLTTESLERLMRETIIGLQWPPEMADRVIWALRITDDLSAMDAYRGFIDAFFLIRLQELRGPFGSMVLRGFNEIINDLLLGRSVVEVTPSGFIQALLDVWGIF